MRRKGIWRAWAAMALGGAFILGDCDPTIQATVENGIINTSTAALSSFYRALINLFGEAVADDPNQA
jgi:hypothetical protein